MGLACYTDCTTLFGPCDRRTLEAASFLALVSMQLQDYARAEHVYRYLHEELMAKNGAADSGTSWLAAHGRSSAAAAAAGKPDQDLSGGAGDSTTQQVAENRRLAVMALASQVAECLRACGRLGIWRARQRRMSRLLRSLPRPSGLPDLT